MDTQNPHARRNGLVTAVVILALFVAGLIFFLNRDVAEAPAETSTENNDVVSAGVKDTRKTIESESALASVDISYPEISGLTDPSAEARINAAIYTEAQSIVDAFLGRVDSPLPDMADSNTLSGDYEIIPIARGMISVLVSVSEYASGMAHPNPYILSLVFNIQTGEKVALPDLFRPGSEYLRVLSLESRPLIEKQLGDMYDAQWAEEGTIPLAENFSIFYPTEDALHLIFNPYQVAPYSMGITEIALPYTVLGSVLK